MLIPTLIFCLTVALGGVTQGISGFGVVLLLMPVTAFLFGIKVAIPLVGVLALSLNVYLARHLRGHIRLSDVGPLYVGAVAGFPLGVMLLRQAPVQTLELLLASLVLFFALNSLLGRKAGLGGGRAMGPRAGVGVGVVAGTLGGSIGASAPAVVLYLASQPWPKDRVRAAMATYFLTSCIVISASHLWLGLFTAEIGQLYALGLPCLALGAWTGTRIAPKVSEAAYKKLLTWLILILGLAMLGKNLLA